MKKISSTLAGIMAPFATYAATDPGAVVPVEGEEMDINNVVDWILIFIDWLLLLTGVLAIFFIILGGVLYIVSAGNEKRTATAKKMIMYAIIGLAIVLLSYVIYWFATGTLGSIFE